MLTLCLHLKDSEVEVGKMSVTASSSHPPFYMLEQPDKRLYQQVHRVHFLGSTADLPPFVDSVGIPINGLDIPIDNYHSRGSHKGSYDPIVKSMLCGASWAFILSAIGVSPTYVLDKYPQRQCGGGNLAAALNDICCPEGVCTVSDRDYNWCQSLTCGALMDAKSGEIRETTSNSPFSAMREGYEPYTAFRREYFTNEVNATLPSARCEGRILFERPFSFACNRVLTVRSPQQAERDSDLLYTNVKASGVSPDALDIEKVISTAKKLIEQEGPIFSVIPIYDNFLDRNYKDTNGIYFDQVPYSNRDATRFRGALAVAVVGWGSRDVSGTFSSEITMDGHAPKSDFKKMNVEYWHCKTALGGYFSDVLIPMRVNTRCQLESYRMFKLPSDDGGWEGTFITGGFHGVRKALPVPGSLEIITGGVGSSLLDSFHYRYSCIWLIVSIIIVLVIIGIACKYRYRE
jgi:hypothetical protein